MEIFENKTELNLENAIKVGTRVPKDAATLAWFESPEVNPTNNLAALDLSNNIPENSISFDSKTALVYADELGIIRSMNGSSAVPSRDITISNLKLSTATATQRVGIDEVNPLDYAHYFYISRHFIAGPIGISFLDINSFKEEEKYNFLNIKVVDTNGKEYIDTNSQRKKYRILLEPYQPEESTRTEIGYKIIVLLDSNRPVNLKLIYDKIEIDEKGNLFNQFLSYEEPVNACTLFEEVPEESEVVDPASRQSKKFSIKKYRQKLQSIVPGGYVQNGYQIFTPKKAVTDNRTYETYNWRLIARSNNPVDLENVPYSSELEDNGKTLIRVVNVGVLYSSKSGESYTTAYPYIFARLERSKFNTSKFRFSNPIAQQSSLREQAAYWMVDIDEVEDLTEFDILAWYPTGEVQNYQAAKIKHFLNASGTLLMDLSNSNSNAAQIDYKLSIDKQRVRSDEIRTNFENKILSQNTSGGWNIVNDNFISLNFGIHGINLIESNSGTTNKTYSTFSADLSGEDLISLIKQGSLEEKPIAVHLRNPFQDGSVNQSNIIATTFGLFNYCNGIYSVSDRDRVVNHNNGETIFEDPSGNIVASVLEGPFKFLYNIVCYGLYSKIYSLRTRDLRSSLYSYVAGWESSWVMDEKALLPEEKEEYFLPSIIDDTNRERFVRSILDSQVDILTYYKQLIYDQIPEYLRYRFTYIENLDTVAFGNIDFFIESTNPDVNFSNAEEVDPDEVNVPASYKLFKIKDPRQTVYAYTDISSPLLEPYPGMGPFIVVDKSRQSSSTRDINNLIDPINYFATYPYDLSSMYYYFQSEEKAFNFNFSTVVNGTAKVSGTERFTVSVCNVVDTLEIPGEAGSSSAIGSPVDAPRQSCTNIVSRSLKYASGLNRGPIFNKHHSLFPHTRDTGNDLSVTWQSGRSGAYVAYIQYTVNLIKGLYSDLGPAIVVDGIYGPQTESAVRAIQGKFRAITLDGKVNSETKYILADQGWKYVWVRDRRLFEARLNAVADRSDSSPIRKNSHTDDRNAIQTWIRNASQLKTLDGGVLTPDFEMITYSGSINSNLQAARNSVTDIIIFQIPQGMGDISRVGVETRSFTNFKIKSYGYSPTPINDDDLSRQDISKFLHTGNSLEIELPSAVSEVSCRYFYIEIEPGQSSNSQYKSYGLSRIYARGKILEQVCPTTGPVFWNQKSIKPFIVGEFYTDSFKACGAGPITYVVRGDLPSGVTLQSNGTLSGTPTEQGVFNFLIKADNGNTYSNQPFRVEVGTATTFEDVITCTNVPREIEIPINVQFTVNNSYQNLTPASPFIKKYDTNTIKQEQYVTLTATFTTGGHVTQSDIGGVIVSSTTPVINHTLDIPIGINFSTSNFSAVNGFVDIHFDRISKLEISSVELTEIETDRPIDLVGLDFSDYINAQIDAITKDSVLFTTDAAYYSDSEYKEFETDFDDQYFMINEDGYIFKNQKKLISAPEGVLRFCNEDGSPFGVVSASAIRSLQIDIEENREVDFRYGYFFIRNNTEEDSGVVYGFYDNKEKEFIGKTISYFGLRKRGLDNVYIAIKALDADGNSETVEDFLGPSPNKTFTPTKLPLKLLAPIFSLKYNNSSIIRVNNIRSKLSKFTTWPLVVSNGSFNRKVLIENRRWNDWKNNFVGQELLATYSTVDIPSNTWSTLHGHGKVEIRSEEPILISERKIQTRLYPILNVRHPSSMPGDNLFISQNGIIKPEIDVYTKESIDSDWQKVPYSFISKIDSYNGVIEFNRAIVPSDESLIKIDYVVDSKDSYIYQIEDELVPFNPLFMNDNYNYNQPIYVYIMPTNIYVPENISQYQVNSLKETGLYTNESIIKIGTDSSIFDKFSINYDPFALLLAVVYVVNNPLNQQPNIIDLRTRGGGLVRQISQSELLEIDDNIESYWDVYAPSKEAYPRGGYAIIKIPEEVRNNFQSVNEIYSIVRGNLTAGVAFELQDMDGNEWSQQ